MSNTARATDVSKVQRSEVLVVWWHTTRAQHDDDDTCISVEWSSYYRRLNTPHLSLFLSPSTIKSQKRRVLEIGNLPSKIHGLLLERMRRVG